MDVRGSAFAFVFVFACGGTAPVDESQKGPKRPTGDAAVGPAYDAAPNDTPLDGATDAASARPDDGDASSPDGGTPSALEAYEGVYENASGLPLIAMLDAAQDALDLEVYELHDTAVQAALRRALARGVRVRVVAEPAPLGSTCRPFEPLAASETTECVRIKNLIADVRAAGGRYEPFAKEALCEAPDRCLQHGKLILFDEQVALVSSGNFNATSLCRPDATSDRCNRDYTVVTQDAATTRALRAVFEADLFGQSYDLRATLENEAAQALTVSPLARAPLLDFIASATRSIRIANQYFREPELNAALIAAAERGVRVRLLVSDFCAFGAPNGAELARERDVYDAFERAGVESRVFTARTLVAGVPGYLHAKAIVVDDERAWVGSVNGSVQATSHNREFGLFFSEPAWVLALSQWLAADFGDAGSVSIREGLACADGR